MHLMAGEHLISRRTKSDPILVLTICKNINASEVKSQHKIITIVNLWLNFEKIIYN